MTITSISWVRNEADIIETFVRHHMRFLDRMILINNASTDTKLDILSSLQKEGLPIDIRTDESTIHRQGEALTELMHELHITMNPDWIVPLDADEFLTSSTNVREIISNLQTDLVSLIPWKTYVPTDMDNPHETTIIKRLSHRRSIEHPQYYKILIPRAFQDSRYNIPLGSHTLECSDSSVPTQITNDLFLAHFPVRSAAQIQRKVTESWERHSANPQKKEDQNYHWQHLYAELSTSIPSVKRVQEIAEQYAMPESSPVEIVFDPISA